MPAFCSEAALLVLNEILSVLEETTHISRPWPELMTKYFQKLIDYGDILQTVTM